MHRDRSILSGKLLTSLLSLVVAATACGDDASDAPEVPVNVPNGGGRFATVRPGAPMLTAEQQAAFDELSKLGYADGSREAPEVASVTLHDARAEDGVNFYTSGHGTEALLVDMDGEVLHRWSYDYDRLWPEHEVKEDAGGRGKWRRAHLYPNGDLLAIHEGIGMIKLDRESNLVWEYPGGTHHDMDVLADGTIWVLAREVEIIPRMHEELPSMDDFLVELAPDGTERRRISVLECLENGARPELLERVDKRDLFHTNSIEVLDGRIAERVPEFAAGNVLISMRHLDAIGVVDVEGERLVWALTGPWTWQHDPKVLENGNLLLFDNRGSGEERSTVYEVDPATGEVVWSYTGTADAPFYSHTCGTAYRLAGGNTLITESDAGRSFEVTPGGELVWEFYNPHRAGEAGELIATLFDLRRFARSELWLDRDDE